MRAGKRYFDCLVCVLGLAICSPLFLLIALAIKLGDGGSVFFRQERVGQSGKPFRIWKFRTMIKDADRLGPPLTVGRDARITRVGLWLRKCKLDELPQLFNVIAGEMSLVGPRPEVVRYVSQYNNHQQRVLDLVPGITDPASVAYRAENDLLARSSDPERLYLEKIMPDKIRINIEYAQCATLWSDIKVILQTIFNILV